MTDLIRVTKEEIDQEIAYLKLTGVQNPSRALVYKRLSRSEAIFDEIPVGATPLWSEESLPDPAVTEQLVNWALEQSEKIGSAVLDFLESSPTEEEAQALIKKLKKMNVEIHSFEPKKAKSLTLIIMESLEERDYSTQELYQLARSVQPSNRPEAAIRQILRRLRSAGVVQITNGSVSLIEAN